MIETELISIIIPTFNRGHLVEDTLESFKKQTHQNWEIFVIDDHSTDNTKAIIEEIKDDRIKYYLRSKEYKKGPAGSRNYGISLSNAEFVLIFDDDDIAHPQLLEFSLHYLKSEPNVDFCRYKRGIFYKKNKPNAVKLKLSETKKSYFKYSQIPLVLDNTIPFNTCAILWKKECFENQKFNEELFYSDEWEFYYKVLKNNCSKGILIDQTLFWARKHEVSSTNNFHKGNKLYLNSTKKALKLVLNDLPCDFKTAALFKFYLRESIRLKDEKLLHILLKEFNLHPIKRLKYKLGFKLYPVLQPIFKLKSKLK